MPVIPDSFFLQRDQDFSEGRNDRACERCGGPLPKYRLLRCDDCLLRLYAELWGEAAVRDGPLPADTPRPDLTSDYAQWVRLLDIARVQDRAAFEALYTVRQRGGRLVRSGEKYQLQPDRDYQGDYDADRQALLVPHTPAIKRIFEEFHRAHAPAEPDRAARRGQRRVWLGSGGHAGRPAQTPRRDSRSRDAA